MAQRTGTYTYGDALNIISRQISRAVEDDVAATIANLATNLIWTRYDWRETISKLPPFYLIPGEQDHGAPTVTIPNDFFGLRKASLIRNTTIPVMRQPITPIRDLELTHFKFLPHAIGYVPASKAFRLFPRVPDNLGAPDYMVEGEYKIRPPKIQAGSLASTTLPFDDVYYQVWIESMKWAGMMMSGDQRAGEVGFQNGQKTYSGQLSKAIASLDEMARNEGLELNDPVIKPSEPLVTSGAWYPSIWGVGVGRW